MCELLDGAMQEDTHVHVETIEVKRSRGKKKRKDVKKEGRERKTKGRRRSKRRKKEEEEGGWKVFGFRRHYPNGVGLSGCYLCHLLFKLQTSPNVCFVPACLSARVCVCAHLHARACTP